MCEGAGAKSDKPLSTQVVILEIVDARGKSIMAPGENFRLFEIVEDGRHVGARGTVFDLHAVTGRVLHWNHNRVILNMTGEQVSRAALMEAAGDTLS